MRILHTSFCILLFTIVSCYANTEKKDTTNPPKKTTPVATIRIKMLPLGKTNQEFITSTFHALKLLLPDAELLPNEEMPRFAFYKPRNRYRADSLIHWMRNRAKQDEVYLGITMQDISTTKDKNKDYGIMGLGYRPGKACVASSFRLKNKRNFFKVVIHELGHTSGLPHCPEKTCFMRDAEGGDPTGDEKEFCVKCKRFLISKGWRL